MKKKYFTIWICFLFLVLFNLTLPSYGQNKPITNTDIVEMSKAGLSDLIIITKIKESETSFILTTSDLINLKQEGVSDSIIKVMIESQSSNPKDNLSVNETREIKELKDAIGLRKIYLDSDDRKSKEEIIKVLTRNGFKVIPNEREAELKILFNYETHRTTIQSSASTLIGSIADYEVKQKWGQFKVFIVDADNQYLIFSMERKPADRVLVKSIQKQAEDYTKDFIKELTKQEKR